MKQEEYYEVLIALNNLKTKQEKCELLSKYIFNEPDTDCNGFIEELIKIVKRLDCDLT